MLTPLLSLLLLVPSQSQAQSQAQSQTESTHEPGGESGLAAPEGGRADARAGSGQSPASRTEEIALDAPRDSRGAEPIPSGRSPSGEAPGTTPGGSAEPSTHLDPAAAELAAARDARRAGELGPALASLRRALAEAPSEPAIRMELVDLLVVVGKGEEALEVLAPLRAAFPGSAWLATLEGRARLAEGDRDGAAEVLRRAVELAPRGAGEAHLLLADLWLEEGELGEAQTLLEGLAARVGSEPAVALRVAHLRRAQGRPSAGIEVLRAALERAGASAPDSREARLLLASLLLEADQPAEAWDALEPLTGMEVAPPLTPLDAQRIGAIARRAERPLEALAFLGAALRAAPTDARTLHELDELLEHEPDLRGRIVARRAELAPTDPAAQLDGLTALAERGQWRELLEQLEALPGELRFDERVLLLEGRALRRTGQAAEARRVLGGLTGGPEGPRASYELGLLNYAAGEFEEAQRDFARATTGELAAEAHFNRGVALDRLGRYRDAVEAYRGAVAARPDYSDAYLQAGLDLKDRLGDAAGAREALRRYLELGGDDPDVRHFVGGRP